MSKKLDGKVALVTGGSTASVSRRRYVSPATARRCSSPAAARKNSTAPSKQIGPRRSPCKATCPNCRPRPLYDVIKQKAGRLDVLFANAGGGEFLPLGQITEAHYDKWFGINVKGLLFTVQKALPLMPTARRSS
jgi:NAD(P)-dependent dehydrogenase (short-subunit alcohol dehydrogenase family)